MRPPTQQSLQNPQINIAKIPFGAGLVGGIAAVGLLLIMLIDIPQLWYIAPAALVLGAGVALVLHFVKRRNPGTAWILPATKR